MVDRAGFEVVHDDRPRLRWAPDEYQAQGDHCDQRSNNDRVPAAPDLVHGAEVVDPIPGISLTLVPQFIVLLCPGRWVAPGLFQTSTS
jgi:hypothetical protein